MNSLSDPLMKNWWNSQFNCDQWTQIESFFVIHFTPHCGPDGRSDSVNYSVLQFLHPCGVIDRRDNLCFKLINENNSISAKEGSVCKIFFEVENSINNFHYYDYTFRSALMSSVHRLVWPHRYSALTCNHGFTRLIYVLFSLFIFCNWVLPCHCVYS